MLPCLWTRTGAMRSRLSSSNQHHKLTPNAHEPTAVCAWRSLFLADNSVQRRQRVPTLSHRLYTTSSGSTATPPPDNSSSSSNDSSTTAAEENTSDKLRRVLRKVPFPVVVVSTASRTNPSLRRGITVSSFSSISLHPIPLIAFCVKLPSRASTVLHESDQFVVQFLAADQIAHSVAFSSSVPPPPSVAASLPKSVLGSTSIPSTSTPPPSQSTSQEQVVPRATRHKVPKDKDTEDLVTKASRQTLIDSNAKKSSSSPSSLTSDPDPFEVLGFETDPESNLPVLLNTLGAVRCSTHRVMVVGDHEMWIGHVEKVLHGEIPNGQEPLLYHDRSYRRVGRRIL
ncbi:flavin reductase like domain-containing protein [Dissophora ornata]|nr:flavin reductase like domain-containing protein [Dissophora ornata]